MRAPPLAPLALLLVLLVSPALAQKSTPPKTSSPKAPPAEVPAAEPPSDAERPRGRLPNNYGKLELEDAQRDRIYAIQARYADQIDNLEAQLEALKAKQKAEIEAVLTPDQKQRLAAIQAESKSKKTVKDSPAESKPAPRKP